MLKGLLILIILSTLLVEVSNAAEYDTHNYLIDDNIKLSFSIPSNYVDKSSSTITPASKSIKQIASFSRKDLTRFCQFTYFKHTPDQLVYYFPIRTISEIIASNEFNKYYKEPHLYLVPADLHQEKLNNRVIINGIDSWIIEHDNFGTDSRYGYIHHYNIYVLSQIKNNTSLFNQSKKYIHMKCYLPGNPLIIDINKNELYNIINSLKIKTVGLNNGNNFHDPITNISLTFPKYLLNNTAELIGDENSIFNLYGNIRTFLSLKAPYTNTSCQFSEYEIHPDNNTPHAKEENILRDIIDKDINSMVDVLNSEYGHLNYSTKITENKNEIINKKKTSSLVFDFTTDVINHPSHGYTRWYYNLIHLADNKIPTSKINRKNKNYLIIKCNVSGTNTIVDTVMNDFKQIINSIEIKDIKEIKGSK